MFKNDADLLKECGFLESDISRLNEELKIFLMEKNEEYLDYFKNEEESIIEKFLYKQMEQ